MFENFRDGSGFATGGASPWEQWQKQWTKPQQQTTQPGVSHDFFGALAQPAATSTSMFANAQPQFGAPAQQAAAPSTGGLDPMMQPRTGGAEPMMQPQLGAPNFGAPAGGGTFDQLTADSASRQFPAGPAQPADPRHPGIGVGGGFFGGSADQQQYGGGPDGRGYGSKYAY